MKSFVRMIFWGAVGILVLIMISHFLPDLFWGLVGLVGMIIGWSAPIVFVLLFVKSWKLSKKIGMSGPKARAKFMVLRAFQDVFRGLYIRMVHGDSDTKPELTKAQRLRLLRHDRAITEQQLNEGLASLRPAKRRTNDDSEAATPAARPAPRQVVPEAASPVIDRTAVRSAQMAQPRVRQAPTTPVQQPVHDVPVDETVELDEIAFKEPTPAPEPPRPARHRPTSRPRPSGSNVNNGSGFGGSIRISGDWGQKKD